MQNVLDVLTAVRAAYPCPVPMTPASLAGDGYDVAGAFLRYVIEHGILTHSQCHDIALNPHNSPRYPTPGLLGSVLACLNPLLHPETSGYTYAATIINQSEKGHYALAYQALERALTPALEGRNPMFHDITTTNNETFTALESADLARMIYKRFGYDKDAAAAAWRRMFQNDCPTEDFVLLAHYHGEERTPHGARH